MCMKWLIQPLQTTPRLQASGLNPTANPENRGGSAFVPTYRSSETHCPARQARMECLCYSQSFGVAQLAIALNRDLGLLVKLGLSQSGHAYKATKWHVNLTTIHKKSWSSPTWNHPAKRRKLSWPGVRPHQYWKSVWMLGHQHFSFLFQGDGPLHAPETHNGPTMLRRVKN